MSFARRLGILLILISPFQVFSQDQKDPDLFLNAWHQAAAKADANSFFGSIAEDGIYIGTDSSERWNKAEFLTFAKPYFDRGTAWDFKPFDRDIHYSPNGKYAWFSELLNTWMGVCRGSGIMEKTKQGWRIKQYHLSVTVPNEIVRDFIRLVDQYHQSAPAQTSPKE